MPPWFPYLLALSAYVAIAGVVWCVCGLLAIVPRFRRLTGRVALSTLASFPGVVCYQIAAFPFCLGLLVLIAVVARLLGSESPAVERLIGPAALLVVGLFALASLCGLYAGWTAAWKVSGGAGLVPTLRTHPLIGDIGTMPGRISRQLRYIWRTSMDPSS